jgi:hypothetical protein
MILCPSLGEHTLQCAIPETTNAPEMLVPVGSLARSGVGLETAPPAFATPIMPSTLVGNVTNGPPIFYILNV